MMHPSIDDGNVVRVIFRLNSDEWHGNSSEGLWAEPLEGSDSGDLYRLRNSPFFARGVSFEDVVRAKPSEEYGGTLEATALIQKCGHSNYMLLFEEGDKRVADIWTKLKDMGCAYESTAIKLSIGKRWLYAVDVPPLADITKVQAILKEGEEQGIWMCQEGSLGHEVPSKPTSPKT